MMILGEENSVFLNKYSMQTIKEVLYDCQARKTAVLATNFYNYETLVCVAKAAQAAGVPVMLQLTRSSIDYMGIHTAYKMGRQVLADYGLQGYIHLDHGPSLELVQRCLDEGFDSVMIDASEKPFDENVAISAKAVEMAKPYGANVEAELGYVAKLGQEQGGGFTTPEQAPSAPPTASTSSRRTSTSRALPPSTPRRRSRWCCTAAPASRTTRCARPSPTAS